MQYLSAGRLVSSRCVKCEHIVWPPSNVCPNCLSDDIEWVDIDGEGSLVEFSESYLVDQPIVFGLVELKDKIRLIAKIRCDDISQLEKGIPVRMVRCGVRNNDPYYEFQPTDWS